MSKTIHSYPKIYNLGHPAIKTIFDTPVVVQEKYDGSQLSWKWDDQGSLHVKSKGKMQYGPEATPDKMFVGAIDYLLTLDPPQEWLDLGVTFRGEWFAKAKQNTLAYEQAPTNGLMLFDVEIQPNLFAPVDSLPEWADLLGIDVARTFVLDAYDLEHLEALLDEVSTLGGPKIEGVVIKAYEQFTRDGKVMMGKHVSPDFKERHQRTWKRDNPGPNDLVQSLIEALDTEARWLKAIQYLRDNGELTGTYADIGPLMKRIKQDTQDEELEYITAKLLEYFLPKVIRGVGRGFPQYYKDRLAQEQFDG